MGALADHLTDALDIGWALLVAVIVTVLCELASEEIRSRLEQLPRLLVHLAGRRLPKEIPSKIREDQVDEWFTVLHDILHDTQLRPITRLCRGIRHGLGVLLAARTVGHELNVTHSLRQLLTVFPRDPLDPVHWSICSPFLPRVQVVLQQAREQDIDTRERAELLMAWARYLLRTEISPEIALNLHREALGVRQRLYQLGDVSLAELADGYHNVAYSLRELRSFHLAASLDAYVLHIRKGLRTEGDEDAAEHLARSLTSLASDLRGCGDPARARALDEEALKVRRGLRRSGHLPDDRDIARSLNNLAEDLRMLGAPDQARRLAERGLGLRQNLFHTDHPDVANSLNTLAKIYRELGNVTQADDYEASARAMRQRLQSRWAY